MEAIHHLEVMVILILLVVRSRTTQLGRNDTSGIRLCTGTMYKTEGFGRKTNNFAERSLNAAESDGSLSFVVVQRNSVASCGGLSDFDCYIYGSV